MQKTYDLIIKGANGHSLRNVPVIKFEDWEEETPDDDKIMKEDAKKLIRVLLSVIPSETYRQLAEMIRAREGFDLPEEEKED